MFNTCKNVNKAECNYILTKDLLKTLSCAYGANWSKKSSVEEMKETVRSALKLLESYENIISEIRSNLDLNKKEILARGLSYRQVNMVLAVNKGLKERDYNYTYQQLFDCIDDYGKGMKEDNYISVEEYLIYITLLNSLLYALESIQESVEVEK